MKVREDIAVLILNYNGETFIEATVKSILDQTVVPHVVMIDNASADRSVEIIKARFPQVEVVQNDRNYDFGIAYNRAVKARHEKYVALLNNDIVMEPDCIENALAFLEREPSAGAAVFIVFEMDQKVSFPYERDYILKPRFGVDLGTRVRFATKNDPPQWMRYIWGGGTLLRRAVFDAIRFDEEFGWYWEDADLGWMMVNRTGFRPAAVPGAIVHHMGGVSVKKRFDAREINLRDHRNSLLSFAKNATGGELLRSLPQRLYFLMKQPEKMQLWRDMRRKRRTERTVH
jgi:GT2 family glycosyltransferase